MFRASDWIKRARDLSESQKQLVHDAIYQCHGNTDICQTAREDSYAIARKLGSGEPLSSHEISSLSEIVEAAYKAATLSPIPVPAWRREGLGVLAAIRFTE